MRSYWQQCSIHTIPYCNCDARPKCPATYTHLGYTVVAEQLLHFYDGEGEPVSDVLRVFYVEVDAVDYPLYLRYHNNVYILTEW